MGRPDFFLIGAQRCGTTSLYRYLRQHPAIFFPEIKEPRFYALAGRPPRFKGPYPVDRSIVHDRCAYEALYDGRGPHQIAGDASTWYMYVEGTPERIRSEIPEAKIVALVRQPADRAYSNFVACRRYGIEPIASFREALAREDERRRSDYGHPWFYRDKGYYDRHLARWRNVFPADRIRVFRTDDLDRDPSGVVAEVLCFLGVDPAFRCRTRRRFNVQSFGLRRRPLRAPKDIRSELTRGYLEDLGRLEESCGFDLSSWKME